MGIGVGVGVEVGVGVGVEVTCCVGVLVGVGVGVLDAVGVGVLVGEPPLPPQPTALQALILPLVQYVPVPEIASAVDSIRFLT